MKHVWPGDVGHPIGPIAKGLIEGRDRLVDCGWCKGTSENGDGEVCILGAVQHKGPLREYLRVSLPEPFRRESVTYFNDIPETTIADVYAVFDRAIARAIGRGV